MSHKHILYIGSYLPDPIREDYPTGSVSPAGQSAMDNIISSMSSRGHTIDVICPILLANERGISLHQSNEYWIDGIHIIVPPIIQMWGPGVLNYVLNAIVVTIFTVYHSSGKYDCSLFYNFRLDTCVPAIAGTLINRLPAVIQYEDGHFAAGDSIFHKISGFLQVLFRSRVCGGICTNTHLADRLQTSNIAIIRGSPSIRPTKITQDHSGSKPVVMFAGKFDEIRGIYKFLEINHVLSDRELEFWISGYGTDREVKKIKSRCRALNKQGADVSFFGMLPQEEYVSKLRMADVLVNLQDPNLKISKYTFPSKILDFMATKSIVVSTDMSDLSLYLSDLMIIDGCSIDDLSETIFNVTSDLDQYEAQAQAGYDWVSEHSKPETVSNRVSRVIEGC